MVGKRAGAVENELAVVCHLIDRGADHVELIDKGAFLPTLLIDQVVDGSLREAGAMNARPMQTGILQGIFGVLCDGALDSLYWSRAGRRFPKQLGSRGALKAGIQGFSPLLCRA